MKHVIITGGAGFIGSHLADVLLAEGGWRVSVIDDFHPFYPREAKLRNVASARGDRNWQLHEADVLDIGSLGLARPDAIVHIAAKAGVRPSFDDPAGYYHTNIAGTDAVLQFAADIGCQKVVLASSSSVYGANPAHPWNEDDLNVQPISPYAVSKLAAEQVADVYARRDGIDIAALRLFTVYGPRQRPDLAIRKFAELIAQGRPIPLFGDGKTVRDYTYVSDIVAGFRSALELDRPGVTTINLGAGRPVALLDLVRAIESGLGTTAEISWEPEQPGDVSATHASIERARDLLGYRPEVEIEEGIARFLAWAGYIGH